MKALARLALAGLAPAVGCGHGGSDPLTSQECGEDRAIRIAELTPNSQLRMLGDSISMWHHVGSSYLDMESYLVDPCGAAPARRYAEVGAWPAGDGWVSCSQDGVQWTTDLAEAPVSLAAATPHCDATVSDRGLFVVDEDSRDRLWLAEPHAAPETIGHGVDVPVDHLWPGVADAYSHPFVVVGETLWYVADRGDLHQLDLNTGENRLLARGVLSVAGSFRKDLVAWTQQGLQPAPPWNRTTILQVDSGETTVVPGAVTDLDFDGLVFTSEYNLAAVYDLRRRRLREYTSGEFPVVIRADGHGAFILVASDRPDVADDVVFLDLDTNLSATLASGIGSNSEAAVDPTSNGIVVYSNLRFDDYSDGLVRRFSSRGVEVLAEHVSVWFLVGSDDRVLYEGVVGDQPDGTLHMRYPDGTDRVFVESGALAQGYHSPSPGAPGHLPWVDLHGDILYTVDSGPDTGLWRMPFQREGS